MKKSTWAEAIVNDYKTTGGLIHEKLMREDYAYRLMVENAMGMRKKTEAEKEWEREFEREIEEAGAKARARRHALIEKRRAKLERTKARMSK